MGRPAKSSVVKSRKISKEAKKKLVETEQKLKGENDKLVPQKHLNKRQKEIFSYILNELSDKNILGNLDLFVLNQTAIVIERLEQLDKQVNKSKEVVQNSTFKATREMYTKDFFRCCNELCLSPQSRAKLSIAVASPENKKTLMDILNEDEDEED